MSTQDEGREREVARIVYAACRAHEGRADGPSASEAARQIIDRLRTPTAEPTNEVRRELWTPKERADRLGFPWPSEPVSGRVDTAPALMDTDLVEKPGSQHAFTAEPSEPVAEVREALERFAEYGEGWDGYGAPPFTPEQIDLAGKVAAATQAPDVCPYAGGIAVEVSDDLTIYVEDPDRTHGGPEAVAHYARPVPEPSEPVAKLTAEEQRHDGSILILCEAVFKDLGLSPGESMYVYAHLGWRPIETAPKDGTWILVCKWPLQNLEAAWGIFVHRAAWWADEGDGHGRDAWIVYNSMALDPECHFEPTHWMPLPAPPAHPAPEDQP